MATIHVSIASDGSPTPSRIRVHGGDTVVFQAAADTVLCVDPKSLFGTERFEIPGTTSIDLLVQPDPPAQFEYLTMVGDLGAACGGGRGTGGSGGGSGGGGPG